MGRYIGMVYLDAHHRVPKITSSGKNSQYNKRDVNPNKITTNRSNGLGTIQCHKMADRCNHAMAFDASHAMVQRKKKKVVTCCYLTGDTGALAISGLRAVQMYL